VEDLETAEPATDAERVERGPRRLSLVAGVAIVVIAVDQFTKWLAVRDLTDRPVHLLWTFQLNLLRNTGAAFSMGNGKGVGPWISVLALFVVAGLSFGYTSRLKLGAVATGLIAGGAIGNLLDRAFRGDAGFMGGAVIDFIDAKWWPVFNIADASIVVGALLLAAAALRAERIA